MIRYFLILLGIILFPGSMSAQALSPWVQAVLDRSNDGVALSQELEYTSCEPADVRAEFNNNHQLFTLSTDIRSDIATSAQLLRERTVCFDHDRAQLQLALRSVADALTQATQECRIESAKALRENYAFLVQAYRDFVDGAVDPSFPSSLLQYRWRFHDRDLWDEGTEKVARESTPSVEACPFSSDYGPHAYANISDDPTEELILRSVGCDLTVLSTLGATHEEEAGTLRKYIETVGTFARDLFTTLQDTMRALEQVRSLRGSSPPPSPADPPPTEPPHFSLHGCVRPEEPRTDDAELIESILLTYPDFFEDRYFNGLTFDPETEQRLPDGVLFRPRQNYFSVYGGSLDLLRAYTQVRSQAEERRQLPPAFLPQESEGVLAFIMRFFIREKDLRDISLSIHQETSYVDAVSRDSIERVHAAVDPLEEAVGTLADVTKEALAEKYIPELTYFLARSCVDGHCQETLKTVAKRTFNPYCVPYVSGLYTEQDAFLRCYCDLSVQESWSEWETYCSDDAPSPAAYQGRQDEIDFMCVE